MSFLIGNWNIEVVGNIEQKRLEYEYCDEKGEEVIYEKGTSTKGIYKNKEGVILSKVYKKINGKPYDKFKKTEKVNIYAEVPKTEVYDLIVEKIKLVRNEELRQYLLKEDKALGKFLYVDSSVGYKAYIGYIVPFQDKLIMYLGFGSITKQIKELEDKKGVAEVIENKIANANPEELLVAING